MERLANERSDISLRVVDIVDWESEVAAQYSIRGLPTLWLYEDGRQVATELGDVLGRLNGR